MILILFHEIYAISHEFRQLRFDAEYLLRADIDTDAAATMPFRESDYARQPLPLIS